MLYQWVSKLVLRFQSSAAATSLYTQEFLLSPSSSSVHSHSSHTFPFLPIPPPFSPPSPVISLCAVLNLVGVNSSSVAETLEDLSRGPWLFCLSPIFPEKLGCGGGFGFGVVQLMSCHLITLAFHPAWFLTLQHYVEVIKRLVQCYYHSVNQYNIDYMKDEFTYPP